VYIALRIAVEDTELTYTLIIAAEETKLKHKEETRAHNGRGA